MEKTSGYVVIPAKAGIQGLKKTSADRPILDAIFHWNGYLIFLPWEYYRISGGYLNRLRGIFDGRVWWGKPNDSSSLIVFTVRTGAFIRRVAPDVEGANPGQALSAGFNAGGQRYAGTSGP